MSAEELRNIYPEITEDQIKEAVRMFPRIALYDTHPQIAEYYVNLYLWAKSGDKNFSDNPEKNRA
jgi:hypothetical protein